MEKEEVINEIEEEIKKAKADPQDFEIEITDDPKEEAKDVAEEKKEVKKEEDPEYGEKVQKRIKKLVDQRREAELETRRMQEQNAQLEAIEEGDTETTVKAQERLADMRAAIRVAEMQKQMRAQQAASPTVGRAQQVAQNPTPTKAMDWWQKNRWFNSAGYEKETAAARSIDIQLDVEGYDKNSDEYYDLLNNRLHSIFPELNSVPSPSKTKVKSRQPVAPIPAGGSSYKGNRVRMTQDQLRMARELGITDEQSLKKYESEIKKQQRS